MIVVCHQYCDRQDNFVHVLVKMGRYCKLEEKNRESDLMIYKWYVVAKLVTWEDGLVTRQC